VSSRGATQRFVAGFYRREFSWRDSAIRCGLLPTWVLVKRKILCEQSIFFAPMAVLRDESQEQQSRVILLIEDEPRVQAVTARVHFAAKCDECAESSQTRAAQ